MRIALSRLDSPVLDKADAIARMARIYKEAVAGGADLVAFPELSIPAEGGNGFAGSHLLFSRPDLDRLAVQTGTVPLLVGCTVRPLPEADGLQNSVAVFSLLDGAIQELELVAPRMQIMRYRGHVFEAMILRNCWLGQEQMHECYRPDCLAILEATAALDFFEHACFQADAFGVSAKNQPITACWHLLKRDADPVSDSGTIRADVDSGARNISVQGAACLVVDLASRWPGILDSVLILGCATQLPMKVGNVEIAVEVQRTYLQLRAGMMFRGELTDGAGMLFVYRRAQRASFFMRNTVIPLSCAYLNSEGVILEIHDMEPLDETPIGSASREIRFVLEVNQGWFTRHKVGIGARMTINEMSPGDCFFAASN